MPHSCCYDSTMFGLFKPKHSAVEMGTFFADAIPKILTDSKNDKLAQQIAEMISSGASPDRIRAEWAAFNSFVTWLGMASALQQHKVPGQQFETLVNAYYQRLEEISRSFVLDPNVSVSYSSFGEYLIARLDGYINISTTSDHKDTKKLIVDKFCDYACDREPSANLKMIALSTYLLASGTVCDILSGVKLQ